MAYDVYAQRKAQEFLEMKQFSEEHVLLTRAGCHNEACAYEKTKVMLDAGWNLNRISLESHPDDLAQFYYLLGSALRHIDGEHDRAAENLRVREHYP